MAKDYEINLKVDTGSSVSDLNNLESALSGISDELVPLTSQMGEMEDKLMLMAYAGDTTSDEFKRLSHEVAGMRKSIRETDAGLEALSLTTSQKLGGALGGVTSGFETFQGAMGAFGTESEEIEKALLKVQSAMALTQGIAGIKEALPSFTALKTNVLDTFNKMTTAGKAFALTGIGLAVTAVTSLMNALDKSNEKQEQAQKFSEAITGSALEEANALNKLKAQINDETLSRSEKNEAVKKLQETYPHLLANVNAEKTSINDLNKAIEVNTQLVMLRAKAEAVAAIRAEEYKKQMQIQIELDQERNEYAQLDFNKRYDQLTKSQKQQIDADSMVLAFNQEKIKAINNNIKSLDDQDKAIQKAIANTKKQGATDQDFLKQQQQAADAVAVAQEKAEEAAEKAEEKRKERAEAQKQWLEEQKSILQQITEANRDYQNEKKSEEDQEVIASQQKWDALITDATKYKLDTKQLLLNKEEEEKAIRKKYADEIILAEKEKQDALNKIIKEARENDLQIQEDYDQKYYEATTSAQQLELDAVGEKYFYLVEMAKQYGYDTKKLEDDRIAKEKEITDKYAKEKKDADDLAAQTEADRITKLNDLRVQSVTDTLTTIGNLTTLFAGKSEKAQKRAFNIQKAVNIAQAIMDTYKAANVALASAPPPYNFIAMAAAITTGLVNVKSIMAQKFEGSGSAGGGTGGTVSSGGGGTSTTMTPQFNVVGNSGLNQLAQVAGQPVQAYVVSGQITTAQSLDRNKIENATL
jgi:hypothetical protein